MENEVKTNVILDWKMDDYARNKKDFVAPQELTVTITLNEYRDLVSANAKAQNDIDKANKDKYQREEKIKSLEKENAMLKQSLYEQTIGAKESINETE